MGTPLIKTILSTTIGNCATHLPVTVPSASLDLFLELGVALAQLIHNPYAEVERLKFVP
jgi:hypothetical protein